MKKIVVLNTKGGCGKSTIATNLAAYHALAGLRTSLMDYDPQGSSMRWLSKRDETRPRITGVPAFERNGRVTRSWQVRVPVQTECLVVDTPAGLEQHRLLDITRNAHAVVVPVLPSDIDIHAASRCIADLLLVAKIDRRDERIAVLANRAKKNTRTYHALTRFLHSLDIPFATSLRDTQNYVNCSEQGIGIHEIADNRAIRDRRDWQPLLEWIGSRRSVPVQLVSAMAGNKSF